MSTQTGTGCGKAPRQVTTRQYELVKRLCCVKIKISVLDKLSGQIGSVVANNRDSLLQGN